MISAHHKLFYHWIWFLNTALCFCVRVCYFINNVSNAWISMSSIKAVLIDSYPPIINLSFYWMIIWTSYTCLWNNLWQLSLLYLHLLNRYHCALNDRACFQCHADLTYYFLSFHPFTWPYLWHNVLITSFYFTKLPSWSKIRSSISEWSIFMILGNFIQHINWRVFNGK